MQIAAVQFSVRPASSFDDFASRVQEDVAAASGNGAELVVFPEYFTAGLVTAALDHPVITPDDARLAFETSARKHHADYRELFAGLSAKHDAVIVAGTHFYWNSQEDRFYNASFVFRPDGTITEQRKIHVTYELLHNKELVSRGDQSEVIDIGGTRIGVLVCYDAAFPEVSRRLTSQGAEILINPVATIDEFGVNRFRAYAASRALENQCYVVNCQLTGGLPEFPDPALGFQGRSSVHAPVDKLIGLPTGLLADAASSSEQIIYAELDLELLRDYRNRGVPSMLADRRPSLYDRWAVDEQGAGR